MSLSILIYGTPNAMDYLPKNAGITTFINQKNTTFNIDICDYLKSCGHIDLIIINTLDRIIMILDIIDKLKITNHISIILNNSIKRLNHHKYELYYTLICDDNYIRYDYHRKYISEKIVTRKIMTISYTPVYNVFRSLGSLSIDGCYIVIERLKKFISRKFNKIPINVLTSVFKFIKSNLFRMNDGEITKYLRDKFFVYRKKHNYCNMPGRTKSRIKDLDIISSFKCTQYLDIGCAEGGLTSAIGHQLQLDKPNIHGCDLYDIDNNKFIYTKMKKNNKLPYKDNQFQVVSFIMSLHHIVNINDIMCELKRITSKNAKIIIREHDCSHDYTKIYLDIIHIFYMFIVSDERDINKFNQLKSEIISSFRSKKEWDSIFNNYGFKNIKYIDPGKNLFDSYYSIYDKIHE